MLIRTLHEFQMHYNEQKLIKIINHNFIIVFSRSWLVIT